MHVQTCTPVGEREAHTPYGFVQAKQQAVEIQLAKTTEELAQIKLQQHELQNRLTQAELKTPLDFQVTIV